MSAFGLSDTTLNAILSVCKTFPDIKHVILYGSRARGDYRPQSDIDIAIDAPKMTPQTFSRLWNLIDDLSIIYTIDVVHLQTLTNEDLRKKILQEGQIL